MPDRNSYVDSQFLTPRRSPRFLPQLNHTTTVNPKSATVSVKKSNDSTVGSRISPKLNNGDVGFSSLRRSPRFKNEPSDKKVKGTRVKGGEAETKENCVVLDEGFGRVRNRERKEKRVEVKTLDNHDALDEGRRRRRKKERNKGSRDGVNTQGNLVISDEGTGGGEKKGVIGKRVEVKTTRNGVVSDEGAGGGRKKGGNREIVGVKTEENRVVCDEGFGGERKKGRNGDKRKRNDDEIRKGWTKEQDLALQSAYLTAKPSPHFWKNVSKLVPGKSQQECFDRIHIDHATPVQLQPRSRAKTLKSPIHEFSLSASKLLDPIDIKVRRSNVLKPKNIMTQKSVEKQLQRKLVGDLDGAGDIFSVLEPNIDLSTNVLQPSESLSTPKQLKENKGFLQSCTETSSSSGNKVLSRFSGSHNTNLVSPPVLKKVKNRVLHEKYVNQLRCRESKRRAASMKIIGEGRSIKRKDAVKAAKVALVSEARDAINKFRQSQVNVMDNGCSSDELNDDSIQYEDESQ
ncbi:hypothetical protein DEO72_LG4g1718 [Vigna unguiculata]|uniref:Myb-like domain-containing protein n=1 Tax=Vigna unguiculata TaxID=3917 RepID=A0A4D6LQT2_VIGUN|nr:hypothetical protein DEO72_LG4g1718 [Vigna unguiculata]